tara:strand:- start:2412 stop:2849 length:438 start_codon:yes stop_codon:yes gene_type:complete
MVKIYLKYGVGIAGAMIAYFLILKLVGFHEYPILSAVNSVIMGIGIFLALRDYKRKADSFKYEIGFQLGIASGCIASFIFVLFMAIYIFYLDKSFALNILESWSLNFDNGAQILLFSLFIMSCSTCIILTLAFMQLLKETINPKK